MTFDTVRQPSLLSTLSGLGITGSVQVVRIYKIVLHGVLEG